VYNNPAFQLFLMATAEPYCLCWPTGEDKMLLVSVGTGATANANENLSPLEMNLLYNASSIPAALMAAALNQQDFLCRVFGKCLVGDILDREVGDVMGQGISGMAKLFTYTRYNTELSREGLNALGLEKIEPAHVHRIDSAKHIDEMLEVGCAVAAKKVTASHFAGFPV